MIAALRPRRIAAGALVAAACLVAAVPPAAGGTLRTENVILITADGVRIQELFSGMDPVVSGKEKHSGIYDLERARRLYWRETAEERRRALMPFFWGTLAPQGIVLGNRGKGSRVLVKNRLLFSAPGYAEIMTGEPQPSITSNDVTRAPRETVLEFVQRKLGLDRMQVAVIGSWDGYAALSFHREPAFFANAGYERVPAEVATPRMAHLSELQFQAMALWEEGRSDAIGAGIAVEYLRTYRPRLLYLALGEPDDWAHARRYDRLLDYLNVMDGYLKALWETAESLDSHRGRTTIIMTTDHGRGVTPRDWVDHDEGIPGCEDIWVAVIGPDTPDRGEVAPAPAVSQSDVAATILRFFGLDPREFNPGAGPPIAAAFEEPGPPPAR